MQSSDKSAKVFEATLQPVPLPEGLWNKLGTDIAGAFENATYDCKFEVAFAASVTTEMVLGFLSSIFSQYGNPESLVTDNGPQFTSAAFSSFLKERGIISVPLCTIKLLMVQ